VKRIFLFSSLLGFFIWTLIMPIASAHGLHGGRLDLPVPLWLYLYGAGGVVVLSFIVAGTFFGKMISFENYPRYNLLGNNFLHSLIKSHLVIRLSRLLGVLLLFLVVATGLFGTNLTYYNFAPVFVWVFWWVGMGFVVALFGNLWALVNPWSGIFTFIQFLHAKLTGKGRVVPLLTYPDRLGAWPVFLQLCIFVWIELIYPESSDPFFIGVMGVFYSVTTLLGMLLFGRHVWVRNGELFSVYFGLLSKLSPVEFRLSDDTVCLNCSDTKMCIPDGKGCVNCDECASLALGSIELNIRPFAVGLIKTEELTSGRLAFVLLMLSSVTFDGFMAASQWVKVVLNMKPTLSVLFGNNYILVVHTFGMAAFFMVFLLFYLLFTYVAFLLSDRDIPYRSATHKFLYSLLPIALAYNMAHYWTFLATVGQRIFSIASDPFGYGWDLFNTVGFVPKYGFINASFVWYSQVTLIVVGHVIAVFISHVIANQIVRNERRMLVSQLPILVLMVLYTVTSLWVLSQDIV